MKPLVRRSLGRIVLHLVLLLSSLGLGFPSNAAAPTPARVGILRVQAQLTVSGNSVGSVNDKGGSVAWGDSYDLSLTTEARYEVLQSGTNAYSGDLLDGSASLSVGGGGQSSFQSKYESGTTLWTYDPPAGFETTEPRASASFSSEDGQASASAGYTPTLNLNPPDVSAFTGGFQAALEAYFGVGTSFDFEVPRSIEGWSFSRTHSTNVTFSVPGVPGTAQGSALCTVNLAFIPDASPQWEAILEPGNGDAVPLDPPYDRWLPLGSLREASDEPGNGLPVHVYLQARNGGPGIPPRAKFKFYLGDVSREPGISMNFPPLDAPGCATEPSGPFDLRIYRNDKLRIADDAQSAETIGYAAEAGAGIACYDFGAYGRVKVIAETEDGLTLVAHRLGRPDDTFLELPLDENRNHVADAWEKDQGVRDQNLPANWDGADQPAGQAFRGDGISLYEKYRGFVVLNGVGKDVHERLDPKRKHLFVRNPDRLVREVFESPEGLPESYLAAAECEVRYLGSTGWSGPGTVKDRKRVVNFNCSEDKHAVDQHALHVVVVLSPHPLIPKDVNDLLVSAGLPIEAPLGDGTEGIAYLDPTASAAARAQWRPARTLRIEIYGANVKNYVDGAVLYHTGAECARCTDAEWHDRARAYGADHAAEAGRKYTIELSSTITHEMGHGTGVRHHDPATDSPSVDDLKNCTMRYYGPAEFPRNLGDRFELAARGNNPDSFCRRAHNCWSHIKITDNLHAAAGAESGAAAIPAFLRPPPSPAAAPPAAAATEPAPLEISAELAWDETIAQDPLRFWVRLHGPTGTAAIDWTAGLRLRLSRVLPDLRREEVLAPAAFGAFLRPNAFDSTRLAIPHVTRVAEWLVPPDRAGLVAGRYELAVTWEGRGLAPDDTLPPDGIATLPAIPFEVLPADTAPRQALHQRHLAWERFVADDPSGALANVQEADRLDADGTDPAALQSRLLAASSAARLNNAFEATRFLDSFRTLGRDDNDHFAGIAVNAFVGLAPRLTWIRGPEDAGSAPARLQIAATPSGTYVVERSRDLASWTAISTNTPSTNRFEILDPPGMSPDPRYYRVRWIR